MKSSVLPRWALAIARYGNSWRGIKDISRWGRFQDVEEAAHYVNSCVGLPVFRCTSALNNLVTMAVFQAPHERAEKNDGRRIQSCPWSQALCGSATTCTEGIQSLRKRWIRFTSNDELIPWLRPSLFGRPVFRHVLVVSGSSILQQVADFAGHGASQQTSKAAIIGSPSVLR
jgi:hypothetical protein